MSLLTDLPPALRRRWPQALVTGLLAIAAVTGLRWLMDGSTEVTAVFTRAVGLYPADEVRVLGVRVGRIEEITPKPDGVHVRMRLDEGIRVPAEADAVIVAPSLVSSRYVQFTPAWTGGAQLTDGAMIQMQKTSVPVEWDELKTALDTFARDLGPDSPDGSGPLGRAVHTTTENFSGRGTSVNGTIEELSAAMDVLARNRGDLAGTVNSLSEFTATLRESDQQVRLFADQISTLSGLLAENRSDLSVALKDLQTTLPELQAYLKEDGPLLQKNLQQLQVTTKLLADRRQDLADTLQTSPVAMSNTRAMYDPASRSTTAGLSFPYLESPQQVVCFLVSRVSAESRLCDTLLRLFPFLDTSGRPPAAAPPGMLAGLAARAGLPGAGDPAPAPGATAGQAPGANPAADPADPAPEPSPTTVRGRLENLFGRLGGAGGPAGGNR